MTTYCYKIDICWGNLMHYYCIKYQMNSTASSNHLISIIHKEDTGLLQVVSHIGIKHRKKKTVALFMLRKQKIRTLAHYM